MNHDARSFWGWGNRAAALDPDQVRPLLAATLGDQVKWNNTTIPVPQLEQVSLPEPRLSAPASLAALARSDPFARASHTYGKSYRDIVRGLAGDFSLAPDLVMQPTTPSQVSEVLQWCSNTGIACVPYGGGSSVVGGTEARFPRDYSGAVSLDLTAMNRLLDVDLVSRTARLEAGILGPELETALRPHGLTLRHYPQSFEFSTLGGWIATRSGGHFASGRTHIEDFVASLDITMPVGTLTTRRLPGSGAGPSPDQFFAGSEGALGVITAAEMRLQARPVYRASTSATFPDLLSAVPAVRALAQSTLFPTNCRLLDAREANLNGVGDGSRAVLLLGFESADYDVTPQLQTAIDLVRDHGSVGIAEPYVARPGDPTKRDAQADQWRESFLAAPYLRDALIRLGLLAETFETAVPWDQFEPFHAAVTQATAAAARAVCGDGIVSCRFTHVYPDGVAPYYTVIASAPPGDRVAGWNAIKLAASDAILQNGGTITHHHAVGRDHRPWYDQQIPELFRRGLAASKQTYDPAGILNPGVLIDPLPQA